MPAKPTPPPTVPKPFILNVSSSIIVLVAGNPRCVEATLSTHDNRAAIEQSMLAKSPASPSNCPPPLEFEIDDIKMSCSKLEELVKKFSIEHALSKSAFTLFK